MKTRWDHNEFNTPEEMLARAVFLACVGGLTAGMVLLFAGVAAHDARLAGAGGLALLVGAMARLWLRRQGKFGSADLAWNESVMAERPADDARVAELVQLLRRWDDLERRRGSPGFDPWELQAVRHDIRAMVETDPALDRLFHDSGRAASML